MTLLLGHKVPSAQPALQDPLVQADRKVHRGSKGPLARKGVRVNAVKLVLPVHKGRSGRRDRKVKRAGRDQLALPVRAAKLDRKVPLVLQDQSDHPAPRATPAHPALPCRYRNGHG